MEANVVQKPRIDERHRQVRHTRQLHTAVDLHSFQASKDVRATVDSTGLLTIPYFRFSKE